MLNNNTILSDNTVTIQNILNNNLNNPNVQILNNALNNLTLTIGQVVGVNVLSGTYTFYVTP